MLAISLIFASLSALIHFYIFYLERFVYGSEKFKKIFKINDKKDLEAAQAPFYNLALYNFALAIFTTMAIILRALENHPAVHLMASGMLMTTQGIISIAGMYLWFSSRDKRRAAAIQTLPALIALFTLPVA